MQRLTTTTTTVIESPRLDPGDLVDPAVVENVADDRGISREDAAKVIKDRVDMALNRRRVTLINGEGVRNSNVRRKQMEEE